MKSSVLAGFKKISREREREKEGENRLEEMVMQSFKDEFLWLSNVPGVSLCSEEIRLCGLSASLSE